MVSSLMVCALVPLVGTATLPLVPDDLFVVVSLLLLGTVALALLGLESGTAFGGMGSSRHMTIAALVEPTVLVAVYALSIPVGTSALSAIVAARALDPAIVVSPVSLLAVVALAMAVLAETGRLPGGQPVDPPGADDGPRGDGAGELRAGPGLAGARVLAAADRPAGTGGQPGRPVGRGDHRDACRPCSSGWSRSWSSCSWPAPLVAAVEVFVAKVRLFRVPELLAGSFVLAFLAVTAS